MIAARGFEGGVCPDAGSTVFDRTGRPIRLTQTIGSGGEGSVFGTDDSAIVCKIYRSSANATETAKKIQRLIARRVAHPALCLPRDLVFDQNGKFVGYIMKRAEGRELQRVVFVPPLLAQTFPKWTKRDLVSLATACLSPISALHKANIILGDLNPRNILVIDQDTVRFVDTDSYQVDEFVCPVGTPPFIAADLIGKDLRSTPRTLEHDHFAIATLIFMILLPGKPPYSHAGGTDPAENVRQGHFPYALGSKHRYDGAPAGRWKYAWSHLPRYAKDAFHNTFVKHQAPNVSDWLEILSRYGFDLDKRRLSPEILPRKLKLMPKHEVAKRGGRWLVCSSCNDEFGELNPTETGSRCPNCRPTRNPGSAFNR